MLAITKPWLTDIFCGGCDHVWLKIQLHFAAWLQLAVLRNSTETKLLLVTPSMEHVHTAVLRSTCHKPSVFEQCCLVCQPLRVVLILIRWAFSENEIQKEDHLTVK